MLSQSIFYHQITRKIIVAFGSLFSNVHIARQAQGETIQTLQIPISYAPKEKWLVRIEQDPDLIAHTYTTLPRMSFEITDINYDASRKVNRMNYITCGDGTTLNKMYSPVPYNFGVSLYILTKTQEDALQIVEQILPTFTPEYTMSLKPITGSNIVMDVPIVLNGLTINDEYDGDFETRRFVTYTLNFTLKGNMYGAFNEGKPITNTTIDMTDINNMTSTYAIHESTGDQSTGTIQDLWNEF